MTKHVTIRVDKCFSSLHKRIPQGSISENVPNMVGFGVEDGDVESLSCKMGTAPVLKRI